MSANVNLSGVGPSDMCLPEVDARLTAALDSALAQSDRDRRTAVVQLVALHPTYLEGWAWLGALGRDTMDSYMAYRVGYHRGLDALRGNGWKGSGYVRWSQIPNRGFLKCLNVLAKTSRLIGDNAEADRCEQFLLQLDPTHTF
jgi:hypothetical protein